MNTEEIAAAKSIGPLYKAWPALETFGDLTKSSTNAFDELVKSYHSLPVYPRRYAGQVLFKGGCAQRISMRKSSPTIAAAVTPALRAAKKATANAFYESMQNNLTQMSNATKAEYDAGRLSAYQFDLLRSRFADLATKIEDARK